MKAFQEYHDLIVQFNRALAHRDFATLYQILTDEAAARFDQSMTAQHPTFPFSEDLDVQGILIEGNGATISITYTNRVKPTGESLMLKINITEVNGQLRIAQPFPIVV